MSYSAVKAFGAESLKLEARMVKMMLIIDDVINDFHKYEIEQSEQRAR